MGRWHFTFTNILVNIKPHACGVPPGITHAIHFPPGPQLTVEITSEIAKGVVFGQQTGNANVSGNQVTTNYIDSPVDDLGFPTLKRGRVQSRIFKMVIQSLSLASTLVEVLV